MLEAQSPLIRNQIQQPKSGRKPLQPRNPPAKIPISAQVNLNLKPEWIGAPLMDDSNKENRLVICAAPAKIDYFDASLAEELSAIREKLERLRLDKEKTEKMLRERDLLLEMSMKELVQRGEAQKQLEIEVDRLFRLRELKSSCMRRSSIQSLRYKEVSKKNKEHQSQASTYTSKDLDAEERNESKTGCPPQSPSSDVSTESMRGEEGTELDEAWVDEA
ncbi:hypothetical protein NMG60_11000048 [Bertholletia excelsa]